MAVYIRALFELYATAKYTLEQLTAIMKEQGLRTRAGGVLYLNQIVRILDNPFYAGFLPCEGQLLPGKHEPIITVELFERVQRLRKKKMHAIWYRHEHRLQQLLTCGHCERVLAPEIQKGHTYYRCHNRAHPPTSVREELVTAPLVHLLKRASFSPEERALLSRRTAEKRRASRDQQALLRQQLLLEQKKVSAKRKRCLDGFLSGAISEEVYKEVNGQLLLSERTIEEQLATAAADGPSAQEKALLMFERLDLAYLKANKTEQRQLLQSACSNFVVEGKNVSFQPRKWLEVLAHREKFLLGAPDREKVRTIQELLAALELARISEQLYIHSFTEIIAAQKQHQTAPTEAYL